MGLAMGLAMGPHMGLAMGLAMGLDMGLAMELHIGLAMGLDQAKKAGASANPAPEKKREEYEIKPINIAIKLISIRRDEASHEP